MDNFELLETYYAAHRDELLAFVSSRLGGSYIAEDLVQDVFMRLMISDRLITETTLPCLVYTVARRLICDYYRRRNTREEYEHYITNGEGVDNSMESVISVRELTERLERGLARIPENCREIYRLHIYGGMKVSEISQHLGEGYKSVEHRLGTARKEMRRFMAVAI
ncbi:MAG: sigma-70 family RNA polymerase sigma factor [Prevotella sp.]|nr:sigma-70 family RNA polymerase sigma factor [Prevotella sp.]